MFLLIEFCCGTPPSCLKVGGGGGGGGGLEQFSVSPRPLGFRFGTLGLRVWGQGLTITELSLLCDSLLQVFNF